MGGMENRPIAVFDIDGTLFRSSLFIELVERLIDKGVLPRTVREAYENAFQDWLDRRGTYDAYVSKMITSFRENLKGVPYEEVAFIAGEIIDEKKNRLYRYTRDLVRELKEKGYWLLAISWSPRFIVEAFGHEMGFDKVYGFFYETGPSGNFTGAVEDHDLITNKAAVLERAAKKAGLSLKGSIGVGDTESDIPMLELVEIPIAFNPNKALYDHAQKRGWRVVVERKDVIYEL
jgi:HAD superfamily hydrolase (TIGR01490 family)